MSDVRLDRVIEMFKVLADNPYSILWELVEDFEINGHTVSVKRSTQLKQVIIDNSYVSIGGKMIVHADGQNFTALEYARYRLRKMD